MRMLALAPVALLLLAAAVPPASIDGLPIGVLAPQPAPAQGCAAYLFTMGATRAFAAVTRADPAELTIALDGKVATLARTISDGTSMGGLPARGIFSGPGVTATLALTVAERADVADGAAVSDATLTLDRAGQDSVVVPLAGLVACST